MRSHTIIDTIVLMKELHGTQVDKSGKPYFYHPLRVMLRLGNDASEAERHAALLHDVLEDTPTTAADLRAYGYDFDVVDLVQFMTKEPDITYFDYIDRIISTGNTSLWRVKLADTLDNSCPSRIATLPIETQGIAKRYARTISMIEAIYPDHGVISGDMVGVGL